MPSAEEVRTDHPSKWSDARVVFDNGWFSAICGRWDGAEKYSLGTRWNGGSSSIGFPQSRGKPMFDVVPAFLAIPVLTGLIEELRRTLEYEEDSNRRMQAEVQLRRATDSLGLVAFLSSYEEEDDDEEQPGD